MNTSKFWIITGLITATVIFRLIPHPFNVTPVMAMALFAGAKFQDKKWSLLIPMLTMLLSDVLLSYMNNYTLLHNTIFFVYGAILLSVCLGWLLHTEKINIAKTAVVTLISSVLFFIITNLGVWMFGGLYTADAAGLTNCFIMAIPFFGYSLLGDIFFVAVLFGAYEWIKATYPKVFRDISTERIRKN